MTLHAGISADGRNRMLPPRNTAGPRVCGGSNRFSGLLVGLCLVACFVTGTLGQPATPPPTAKQEIKLDAPRVDWSNALEAHRLIESWVAARRVRGEEENPIRVTGLSGVKVTLRWNGKVLGSGEAYPKDPTADNAVVNLKALAARATRLALEAGESMMQDFRRRALARPGAQPSTQPGGDEKPKRDPGKYLLGDPTIRMVVELQVGLRLEPIHLASDAKEGELFAQFAPDFHGLRLWTDAGRVPAAPRDSWIWPGTALAFNMSPQNQILRLLIQARLDLSDVQRLARPKGPALWRFEIIHVVRPTPDSAVTRLVRGNVLLPQTTLDEATLDSMATRMARNLAGRPAEMPPLPNAERNERATQDLALTAYVLSQWLKQGDKAAVPEKLRAEIEAVVRRDAEMLLARMAKIEAAPRALLLLTLIDTPALGERKVQRDALANSLLSRWNPGGSFSSGGIPEGKAIEKPGDRKRGNTAEMPPTQALIVAALAHLYEQTRDAELGEKVRASRMMQWREFPADRILAALPWMMRTEAYAALLDALDAPATQPGHVSDAGAAAERREKIQKLMASLRDRQVVDPPALGPADVVGGFELTGAPSSGAPSPDWRSAFAVGFLASAMRDSEIVQPHDRVAWLLTCGLGARYLAQLMYDAPGSYYVALPGEVLGATRASLWDNDTPVSATAMSLLAVLDLKKTISEIQAAGGLDESSIPADK